MIPLLDVEVDRLLDWLEGKATPAAAAQIRQRIETDAHFRDLAKPAFLAHSLNIWLASRHAAAAGKKDPTSWRVAFRARAFVLDPLAGLEFLNSSEKEPSANDGAIGTSADISGEPAGGDQSGDPQSRPQWSEEPLERLTPSMRECAEWQTRHGASRFDGRLPHLPTGPNELMGVLFPYLMEVMARGAYAKAFLDRVEIPENDGLTRAYLRRARIARQNEGLGPAAFHELIDGLVVAITAKEANADLECARLWEAQKALEDAEPRGEREGSLEEQLADDGDADPSPEREALLQAYADRVKVIRERTIGRVKAELRAPPRSS